MRGILIYQPPGQTETVGAFIESLDPRMREKLNWQLFRLAYVRPCQLREPHFKHFSLERYRDLYELREKGKQLVRIIFIVRPNGEVLLLHGFYKRQKRDTNLALEQSLRILAELRDHPEYAVEYQFQREGGE